MNDFLDITIFMNGRVEVLPPETLAQLSYFDFEMIYGATENGKKIRFHAKAKKSILGEVILRLLIVDKFDTIHIVMEVDNCPPSGYWHSQTYGEWQVCGRIKDNALLISVCQNAPLCYLDCQKRNDEARIPNLNQMFLDALDHFEKAKQPQ